MSAAAGSLTPLAGGRGLASWEPAAVAALVDPAWDGFLRSATALAADGGLDSPSRAAGRTARDLCISLGDWDDAPTLARLLREARDGTSGGTSGGTPEGSVFDQEGRDRAVIAAHRTASDGDVLAALSRARTRYAEVLAGDDVRELATAPTRSALGILPLLGQAAAVCYQLAVAALDLAAAGAPDPPPPVLHAGLGALTDVVGALAARRRMHVTVAVVHPGGAWTVGAAGADWTTIEPAPPVRADALGCPAVEGPAAVLLDASAGRTAVPALVLRREIRTFDSAGLLPLAELLAGVPGLPAAGAIASVSRTLGGVGRLLGKLPGFRP